MIFRSRPLESSAWVTEPDPLLALALQDLAFYERTRNSARRWHYSTEIVALLSASATVVAAALSAPALVTALLAAISLFTTGIRQVFNPAERWELAAQGWVVLRRAINRYRLRPDEETEQAARSALQQRVDEVGDNELRGWTALRRTARRSSDS